MPALPSVRDFRYSRYFRYPIRREKPAAAGPVRRAHGVATGSRRRTRGKRMNDAKSDARRKRGGG